MESTGLARLARAATYLAAAIAVVTVVGALRLLTLDSGPESELKAWLVAVVLLVGLAVATVVITCGRVLRALVARSAPAGHDTDAPEPDDWSETTELDYVAADDTSRDRTPGR